jgi:hypothetical protein
VPLIIFVYSSFNKSINLLKNFFFVVIELNNNFFICCKFKEKKKLDTKEFLWKQQEMKILEGYNLIYGTKLSYEMVQTS